MALEQDAVKRRAFPPHPGQQHVTSSLKTASPEPRRPKIRGRDVSHRPPFPALWPLPAFQFRVGVEVSYMEDKVRVTMLPVGMKKGIGIGLGVAMTLLVVVAAFQGSAASATEIPAQSQYTTPTNSSGLPATDYAIIGVVIVVVVVGILYYVLAGKKGGGSKPSDEKTSDGEKPEGKPEGKESPEEIEKELRRAQKGDSVPPSS